MKYRILFLLFLVLDFSLVFSQVSEYGVPQIKNFGPADYRQESQNFCVVQDQNSLMYFGNTNGIMEYDNEKWTIVKVPGRPKLSVSRNNEVYYGGYNSFGKVQYKDGHIDVVEFENNLDCTFGQITKIIACDDNDVYFASNDKLFLYSQSSFRKIIEGEPFRLLELDGKAYVQRLFAPLRLLSHGNFEVDNLCAAVDTVDVLDMISYGDHIIIRDFARKNFLYYSEKEGLKNFPVELNSYIDKNEYLRICSLPDGSFIVATHYGGVVSFDAEGRTRYLLNSANGLADNPINDICVDNQGKVWLATENGITLLETNSHLSFFNTPSGIRGAVLSIIRFNEKLYVGTTVGLFCYCEIETPYGKARTFRRVRHITDNCWQLRIYNEHLFAVAHDGLFEINNLEAVEVLEGSFITMKPIVIDSTEYVMLGGTNGLTFTKIEGNKVQQLGRLKGLRYTLRTLAVDSKGRLWMGTDRDGLYMVELGDSLDMNATVVGFGKDDGLPPDFDWVDVYSTHKLGMVFSTSVGVYMYNEQEKKFEKDAKYFCSGQRCSGVYGMIGEDSDYNIWYSCSFSDVYEREVGVIKFGNDGSFVRETNHFSQMRESVVETIYPDGNDVVWFGTSESLIKYQNDGKKPFVLEDAFTCMIRKVTVGNNSILYTFESGSSGNYEIRFLDKKIRFEVAGLSYNTFGDVEYQYKLEGLDEEWSEWTTDSYKEYISLSEGSYKFMVRSRNGYGQISNVSEFSFEVTPPYYRSVIAYILYVLCSIVLVLIILVWRNIVHSREKYTLEKLVESRTNELVLQKEQTERLVKKLLPQNTVDELQQTGNATSKKYEMVTVLFSDIQGFTKIAAETNPEELIKYLNELFVSFDNIISKYNIEKIKTIGDAYMCAGGMPNQDATNPVEVVLAGMEMQRALDELNKNHDLKMKMRVGIHTGPVVAGVVGAQKIEYDIWGDTVNIASRMESHGEVGRVNVSEETYRHVKEFFKCEARGVMNVKNKGEMEMYFVNGILDDLSENGDGITPNHLFNVRKQSLNFSLIQDEILGQMQRDLPTNLYYHNLKHTTDAIYRVTDIGTKEKVSEEDLLLLRCAALFHDSGFMASYDNNEEIGARLAHQTLARYKFSREQIDVVKHIINATKVPQNPHNLLEEIMCDADLDYLGRPDFIPISHNLFRELFERGKIDSIDQWNKMQYKFIMEHHYFTETAKRSGEHGKQQVLKELKEAI